MADRSELRAMVPAALVLAAILMTLAVLQDRWIGRWSEVEDARLRSALVTGADALDASLSERIAKTAEAFVEVRARDADAADSLMRRIERLGPSPLPIKDVYWVHPGPETRLWRLDRDARALAAASWDDLGAEWQQRLSRDLALGPDGTVFLDNRDVPAAPPGLLLPAPGPPEAPLRFVLVQLDADVLADSTLSALVREHLPLRAPSTS